MTATGYLAGLIEWETPSVTATGWTDRVGDSLSDSYGLSGWPDRVGDSLSDSYGLSGWPDRVNRLKAHKKKDSLNTGFRVFSFRSVFCLAEEGDSGTSFSLQYGSACPLGSIGGRLRASWTMGAEQARE